jgi:hypothetical protein
MPATSAAPARDLPPHALSGGAPPWPSASAFAAGRVERDIGALLRLALERASALDAYAVLCDVLGDIELPPASPDTASDAAHLSSAASLYFAAEMEAALLLPSAETLAGLAIAGSLPIDLPAQAASWLGQFWHLRGQRATAAERHAAFAGLFGEIVPTPPASGPVVPPARPLPTAGANTAFEALFLDLCEAFYRLDEDQPASPYGNPQRQSVLAAAAGVLADNLLNHAGAMASMLAADILTATGQVLEFYRGRAMLAAFAARGPWDIVRTIATRWLHIEPDIETHLTRGRGGLIVLSWLADNLGAIEGGRLSPIRVDSPVIAAAAEWMQASLTLSEAIDAAASPASGRG